MQWFQGNSPNFRDENGAIAKARYSVFQVRLPRQLWWRGELFYNKFWKNWDHESPHVQQKQGHKCHLYISHLRQTLEQTEANGSWATSHFQASLLGVCTHLSPSLQITQHQFHQFLRPLKTVRLQLMTVFLMCPVQKTSVSGLGMKTGGLIFSVRSLNSHSSITYCTGILDQSKKCGAVKKIYLEMRMWRRCNKTLYLDRRLVQSCHICPVLSCPRSSDNLSCSTLSICGNA